MPTKYFWFPLIASGLLLGSPNLTAQSQASHPPTAISLTPIGEIKSFHGTLRAKDLQHGTLALGSLHRIQHIVALDSASRLVKENRPVGLAEFQVGDVVEGFAFPDAYGRRVVAVATARAPSEPSRPTAHPPKSGRKKSPHPHQAASRKTSSSKKSAPTPPKTDRPASREKTERMPSSPAPKSAAKPVRSRVPK